MLIQIFDGEGRLARIINLQEYECGKIEDIVTAIIRDQYECDVIYPRGGLEWKINML